MKLKLFDRTQFTSLAVGVIVGIAITSGYFALHPLTVTETQIEYQTVEKPVSEDGIVFEVQGHAPDYPVQVRFETTNNSTWSPVYAFGVDHSEHFVAPLNTSKTYRVVVTDADGDNARLGVLKPSKADDHLVLRLDNDYLW